MIAHKSKTKQCSKCKLDKNLIKFHKDSSKSDGLYSSCRDCCNKFWQSENSKENRKHPRYALARRKHKIAKFGITLEEYDKIFSAQNQMCALCGIRQDKLRKKLAVDHCHKTGKVRALLCGNCNRGLGFFKDSVDLLNKATNYVIRHS